MRKILPIILILLGGIALYGSEPSRRARIYIPPAEQKSLKVEADPGSVIRQPRFKAVKNKAASSSFAARLGLSKDEITWHPQKAVGSGKLRIQKIDQSADRTVIVFMEEIGRNPYGTRLILFDTVNWEFLRVFDLPRQMRTFSLDPKDLSAVFIAEEQSRMKESSGVGIIDLSSGKIKTFRKMKMPESAVLAADNIYAVFANDTRIHRISGETTDHLKMPEQIRLLAVSPDRSTLIAVSDRTIYRISIADFQILSELRFQETFSPYRLSFAGTSAQRFLFSVTNTQNLTGCKYSVYMIDGDRYRLFCSNSAGMIAADPTGKYAYVSRIVRNRATKFDLSDFSEHSYCAPVSLKPVGTGMLKELFSGAAPNEMISIDSTCAISKVFNTRKRWSKIKYTKP